MRTTRLLAGVLLAGAAALGGWSPASAQTAGPAITVAPATGVAAGSMVTVSGTGFAPGGGIYVMFCAKPTGALGTAAGRAPSASCNPDQANDHTVWKTPIPADGTFSVQLKVESSFASVNCATTECGVFVRKDHMGGATDYSQDAYAAVSFAAAQAAPAAPAPAPAATPTTVALAQAQGQPADPQLPRTGTNLTLAVLGAGALGGGAALVLTSRRRAKA